MNDEQTHTRAHRQCARTHTKPRTNTQTRTRTHTRTRSQARENTHPSARSHTHTHTCAHSHHATHLYLSHVPIGDDLLEISEEIPDDFRDDGDALRLTRGLIVVAAMAMIDLVGVVVTVSGMGGGE